MEGAALDNIDLREQSGQRTDGGGLCSTLFAENQNTTDLGIHGVQDQCLLHRILTYNGSKGKILFIHIFFCKVAHISVPFQLR